MVGVSWFPTTLDVLALVAEERIHQTAKHGLNDRFYDGTGPETRWLVPYSDHSAEQIETEFRKDYEEYEEETGAQRGFIS